MRPERQEYFKTLPEIPRMVWVSPIQRSWEIASRVEKGMPVTRKEVLFCIKTLPNNPQEDNLLEKLKTLEQNLLRKDYLTEIKHLRRKLEKPIIVSYNHQLIKSANDIDHGRMITSSQKERMEQKLETLNSLLANNPLRNSDQRRREIRFEKGVKKTPKYMLIKMTS